MVNSICTPFIKKNRLRRFIDAVIIPYVCFFTQIIRRFIIKIIKKSWLYALKNNNHYFVCSLKNQILFLMAEKNCLRRYIDAMRIPNVNTIDYFNVTFCFFFNKPTILIFAHTIRRIIIKKILKWASPHRYI